MKFILLRLLSGTLFGSSVLAFEPAQLPPNIVLMMVDDLGWNHISSEAATMRTAKELYQTPVVERLAQEGLSFTHAYAQPNCAPTRAAMLSGQYPARIRNGVYVVGHLNRNGRGGISKENAKFIGPEQNRDVSAEAITIAEALKKNGYATAHIGKFHVGGHLGKETMPENVGFDINIGGFSQGHQPTCFASKEADAWVFKGVGMGHFDRFAEPYSEAYLAKRKLLPSLKGSPKHISDAMGDALEETIGKLHNAGKPFYLQFFTYAVHGPLRARPDLRKAAIKRTGVEGQMAEYIGFISGVDENLGRVLSALEDPNGDGDCSDSIADNTLVIFTSDNGGTHASNAPLRGVKGMLTEGGMRVPLIVRWPDVVPANSLTHRKVHCLDYYPTFMDLAGKRWLPPVDEHPLDGESFAEVLGKPEMAKPRGPIHFLFPGYMDVRAEPSLMVIDEVKGKRYKLCYFYESDTYELYCLSDDQAEANNLITLKSEIAKELSENLISWLAQKHSTWKPKLPICKKTGKPVMPRPL